MAGKTTVLAPGLYFVATPIGTARDITLRGLDVLNSASVLAAEDTRNTRRLLDIHGVKLEGRKLLPYHDHNGPQQRPKLIAEIEAGGTVAYVSDAGTPLVADPGYSLAKAAIDAGLEVFAAPGASAVLSALTVAGLPTDQFFFAGFAPNKTAARKNFFQTLINVPGTLVFYESPKRVGSSLMDMVHALGKERPAAVCRELTKKFEQVVRGSLGELAERFENEAPKGEIVVVVGAALKSEAEAVDVSAALISARKRGLSVKDAVAEVTEVYGLKRKQVYQQALDLEKEK